MQAVVAEGAGGTEVLTFREFSDPEPGETDLLVRVRAAGVNRADILQRQGLYDPPPGISSVLGLEVAGEVVACGSRVESWSIGDRVCAVTSGGGYAELAVVPSSVALPIPSQMTFVEAGAIPEVFTTAHDNLITRGRLRPGERVLIHGGASGVGTAAIQLAKDRGAEVFVTVGAAEKVSPCRELGADHVIIHREEDFQEAVGRLTSGEGVDVILDIVGAPYLTSNLACLRYEGRLVVIATMHGHKGHIDLYDLHFRRLTVTGSALRGRSVELKAVLAERLKRDIFPGFESGRFRPVVFEAMPIQDVARAHDLLESSRHVGKVVLTLDA